MSYSNLLLHCCIVLWAAAAGTHASDGANDTSTCMTGPSMEDPSNGILLNGRQYIEESSSVECAGVITVWHFCHHVIGFRHLEMELWAGVWRRAGDEFRLVGLNKLTVDAPGFTNDFLPCLNHTVPPEEWIETREGDFIGFYLPNNGVFVASATTESDPSLFERRRNTFGFAENFNTSELVRTSTTFGRALVRAEIGRYNIPIHVCHNYATLFDVHE